MNDVIKCAKYLYTIRPLEGFMIFYSEYWYWSYRTIRVMQSISRKTYVWYLFFDFHIDIHKFHPCFQEWVVTIPPSYGFRAAPSPATSGAAQSPRTHAKFICNVLDYNTTTGRVCRCEIYLIRICYSTSWRSNVRFWTFLWTLNG